MKRKIKIIIAILTAIIAVCVCNKSMDLIEIKDTLLRPFGNIIFIFMVIAIIYIGITKKAEKLLNKKLLEKLVDSFWFDVIDTIFIAVTFFGMIYQIRKPKMLIENRYLFIVFLIVFAVTLIIQLLKSIVIDTEVTMFIAILNIIWVVAFILEFCFFIYVFMNFGNQF